MKKHILLSWSILQVVLVFPQNINAQVVINEVLNNPIGEEKGAEWVELYNITAEPQSLKECILFLDDDAEKQKVILGEEEFIERFKVISWDSSWLNNSGDEIRIVCPNFSDTVTYGDLPGSLVKSPKDGVSFGRSPDGTGNFTILNSVSMGDPNSGPPTSTPIRSDTGVPTAKPKPSISNKLTSTPIATVPATQKLTLATTAAPTFSEEVLSENIAGDSDDTDFGIMNTVTLTPHETVKQSNDEGEIKSYKTEKKLPLLPLSLIVFGVVFLGSSLFPIVKNWRRLYNSQDDEKKDA